MPESVSEPCEVVMNDEYALSLLLSFQLLFLVKACHGVLGRLKHLDDEKLSHFFQRFLLKF